MDHNYGLDYETGWDMARDPQMRPAEEGDGICLWCGGVYPLSELERNEGMCLTCYYASLEPAPEDGEPFEWAVESAANSDRRCKDETPPHPSPAATPSALGCQLQGQSSGNGKENHNSPPDCCAQGEGFTGRGDADSSAPRADVGIGPYDDQNDRTKGRAGRLPALQETEGGGCGDAGKRKKL